MRVALRVGAATSVLLAAVSASAQRAPVATEGASASPALAWVFPTPEASASVAAGAVLEVRVRLPTALTPPPGIQQPEALIGWMAELVAPALAVDSGEPIEARYRVAVSDVRPDGASSLVYRAKLPLAPWTAPGAYALALTTPGGRLATTSPVRVVAVPAGASAPTNANASALAKAQDGAAFQHEYLDGALLVRSAPGASGDVEVLLGTSGRRSVAVEGGRVTWHPGGMVLDDLRAPVVVGALRVGPGQTARVMIASADGPTPALQLPGRDARVTETLRLAVTGAKAGARVAWRIGERHTAWGPTVLTHAFTQGGREDVVAFAVGPDAQGTLLRGAVEARPSAGCSVRGGASAAGLELGWAAVLLGVRRLTTRKRQRDPASWNRLARRSG